ncbi:MAG TPA: RecX family transcriptional regulator [Candidatus Dormibacteraeota bacterium]|nr:RecX family transcriptional regulator [Candidatus Dormibacteraeota bacterium]
MKITGITQQQKHPERYSVFIDGAYAFSLGEAALISSKLHHGQELKPKQAGELKLLASGDKLYGQACRYIALRVRTAWEVSRYLERKQAPPALASELLNKLSNIGLIDDAQYAKVYIHDRQLLRPTSRLKIAFELRKKHVAEEIIEAALNASEEIEQTALSDLIERKRQQSRYKDDLKLMQYLARQGFHYSDIKKALGK